MARLKRPTNGTTSPVTKYLNWKSNDKSFAYYDKEQGKEYPCRITNKILILGTLPYSKRLE